MKIWTDKIEYYVSSEKSVEDLKLELVDKVKLSKTLDDNSKAYQKSLYFVSKELNWFIFPPSPEFRMRINFNNLIQDDNNIARISIRGNVAMSSFKYYSVVLFVLIHLILLMPFPSFNKMPEPESFLGLHSLGFLMGVIILSIIFQWLNIGNIEKGVEELKNLLNNKDYFLKN